MKLDAAARLYAAGRIEEAAQAYRAAERLAPDDIRATYSLAVIDIGQGRFARARRRLEAVVAREPSHFMAQHNLGVVARELGDWSAALRAFETALAARPDAADTRHALAVALAVLGRTAEAVAQHRILTESADHRLGALTRIALLDPAAVSDPELAAMRQAAAGQGPGVETRIGLWFGIGEVLEQRGEDNSAFAAFSEGNRLKRAALGSEVATAADANARASEEVRRRFTAAELDRLRGAGDRTAAPIFVIGFPRSGSTLVEQILASHPDVQGLGETSRLPTQLESRLPQSARSVRETAEAYLASLRGRGWDGVSRFVDKTLENYLHVGLIHAMFPRALILESVRDPMDTCLSCYRQLFARGNETLYDLAEIGAEYRRYRELMAHWSAVLPGRVVRVDYDALVAEPELRIRELITEQAGLPWDPATLRFFEREGAVVTASAAQVRRPINTGSRRRWRRYAHQLGPLVAALGPYGPGDREDGASDGT